jgi:HlyD family secretion protein
MKLPINLTRRQWTLVAGAAVVLLIILLSLPHGDRTQYLTSKVERGPIRDVVEATGPIHAVVLVQVGSQVSGTIAKLNVDFNSRVHSGDVLALIDPALFRGALSQATADLDSARANVLVTKQTVVKERAALVQSQLDYQRAVTVVEGHFQPQQFLDQAKATLDSAKAAVAAAEAAVIQAEAQARQKAAAVDVARTNLDYTVIRSPIDGTVVARNVDIGQTVAASFQAPNIFDIAQDLSKMQVYAKTDESEVGRIKVGQPVTFKVDAFPKETFQGTVHQVRMNATTVQNVVTYDTIVDFANPDGKLFPGMTAYVTIPVASVDNVVKVPNTALRFEPPLPPEQIRALYAEASIPPDAADPRAGASGDAPAPSRDRAIVWKLSSGSLQPVQLTLGITDHAYTEVKRAVVGSLKVNDDVVTAFVKSKNATGPGAPR